MQYAHGICLRSQRQATELAVQLEQRAAELEEQAELAELAEAED